MRGERLSERTYAITYECGAFLSSPPPGWQIMEPDDPALPPICEGMDVVRVPEEEWKAKKTRIVCLSCGRVIAHREVAAMDVNSDEQLHSDEEAWDAKSI